MALCLTFHTHTSELNINAKSRKHKCLYLSNIYAQSIIMAFLTLFLSPVLYVIILLVYGGRYSFSMQELKSLSKVIKLANADKNKVRKKIESHVNRIPKNKKRGYIGTVIVLIVQLTANYIMLDDVFLYLTFAASFAICILSFLVVYWLKGSGTIDDEPRIQGGRNY